MADAPEIATFPRGAKRPAAIDEIAAAIEADGGAALNSMIKSLEEFDLGKIHFGQIQSAAALVAAASVEP